MNKPCPPSLGSVGSFGASAVKTQSHAHTNKHPGRLPEDWESVFQSNTPTRVVGRVSQAVLGPVPEEEGPAQPQGHSRHERGLAPTPGPPDPEHNGESDAERPACKDVQPRAMHRLTPSNGLVASQCVTNTEVTGVVNPGPPVPGTVCQTLLVNPGGIWCSRCW